MTSRGRKRKQKTPEGQNLALYFHAFNTGKRGLLATLSAELAGVT